MIRNVRDLRKTSHLLSRKDEGPGKGDISFYCPKDSFGADFLEDPEVPDVTESI